MKRNHEKLIKVNGVIVKATTISGLADIVGRSRVTLLRWERDGIMPSAPLYIGSYRYYPILFSKEFSKLVKDIPTNRPPSADVQARINLLFNEEKQKYAS